MGENSPAARLTGAFGFGASSRGHEMKKQSETTAKKALENLTDALVEDIMGTPDDELILEVIEDGGDPDKIVADTKALINKAIQLSMEEGT